MMFCSQWYQSSNAAATGRSMAGSAPSSSARVNLRSRVDWLPVSFSFPIASLTAPSRTGRGILDVRPARSRSGGRCAPAGAWPGAAARRRWPRRPAQSRCRHPVPTTASNAGRQKKNKQGKPAHHERWRVFSMINLWRHLIGEQLAGRRRHAVHHVVLLAVHPIGAHFQSGPV